MVSINISIDGCTGSIDCGTGMTGLQGPTGLQGTQGLSITGPTGPSGTGSGGSNHLLFEGFKISYYTFGARDAWNTTTYSEDGVPFNQGSLNKYNHAWAFRPQYLTLREDGVYPQVEVLTPTVGDYTPAYLQLYKDNCQEFWIHISNSDYHGMVNMCADPNGLGLDARQTIKQRVIDWGVKGVDINFESFAEYTSQFVTDFAAWLLLLKTDLNSVGCKLSYAIVSIPSPSIQSLYNFDYSSFIDSVDYLTVMMYDIMDWGWGLSNSPTAAIVGGYQKLQGNPNIASTSQYEIDNGPVVEFYENGILGKIHSDIGDKMHKIICALPNYGMYNDNTMNNNWAYTNNLGLNRIEYDVSYNTSISEGKRTPDGTLRWTADNKYIEYNDGYSLRKRIRAIKNWFDKYELDNPNNNKPYREICIWYMGSDNHTPFD